jgi:hypothetical protein
MLKTFCGMLLGGFLGMMFGTVISLLWFELPFKTWETPVALFCLTTGNAIWLGAAWGGYREGKHHWRKIWGIELDKWQVKAQGEK